MRPVTPVGILAAKLEHLVEQARMVQALDPIFKRELQQACNLATGLDPYLDRCTTPESEALAALVRRTQTEDWSQRFSDGETVRHLEQEMMSGHVEGQFLKFLNCKKNLVSFNRIQIQLWTFPSHSLKLLQEQIFMHHLNLALQF